MEDNILGTEKETKIKLLDGKEYTLPPITLFTLTNVEKAMGLGGKKLSEKFDTEPWATLGLFAYAVLKETTPNISKEEILKQIGIKEFEAFAGLLTAIVALSKAIR